MLVPGGRHLLLLGYDLKGVECTRVGVWGSVIILIAMFHNFLFQSWYVERWLCGLVLP